MKLIELTQVTGAYPEQYEGVVDDGREVYIRHRHGHGSIAVGTTMDDAVTAGWGWPYKSDGRVLLEWRDADWDGRMRPGALAHCLYLAGLDPTPEVVASIATSPDADDIITAAAELGIHLVAAPGLRS